MMVFEAMYCRSSAYRFLQIKISTQVINVESRTSKLRSVTEYSAPTFASKAMIALISAD